MSEEYNFPDIKIIMGRGEKTQALNTQCLT